MLITRRLSYTIPVLIGLALAVVLYVGLITEQDRYEQKSRLGVFYKLAAIQNGFESGLRTRLKLADALAAYIVLHPEFSQKEFSQFLEQMIGRTTGVRHLALLRNGNVDHIYPKEGEIGRDEHVVIDDFPVGIRNLLGGMSRKREQVLSTPVALYSGGPAFLAATPVYLPKSEVGEQIYWGTILMLIDTGTLFRESGLKQVGASLDVAIRSNEDTQPVYGSRTVFGLNPVSINVQVPGGYWQMASLPVGGWPLSPHTDVILLAGSGSVIGVTGLLLVTVYFLLSGIKEREKYRHLIQNAKSIILRIDMDGRISFCNGYAERFFGFGSGELMGKSLLDTLYPAKDENGQPSKRFINRLIHSPSDHLFHESLNIRRNGEMVWLAWANQPIFDEDGNVVELLCVGTDITAHKTMEEALRQNERQYRVLAENVTDIIMGLDAGRRFTYISPSDEALRGYDRTKVLSRPINDFLTPHSANVFDDAMDKLVARIGSDKKGPSTILDLEFACADDKTVWLETRFGLLLNESGELIGMQGVGRDISDRKRADQLRDDVERMARHDLKTPLGAVVGLPEEIRRQGNISQVQAEMLTTIEDAGNTMLMLINRSLDLFKMESGSYKLRTKHIDAMVVIESILNETRTVIREKGISVGIDTRNSDAKSFMVQVEEPLFQSMLSNLLLNAFQASPNGGSVSIILSRNSGPVIAIRNKGEVPLEVRSNFFDKYSSEKDSEGSGLGTYSARLIARTHGGDITVDTTVSGQTTLVVTLPE